MVNTRRPMDVVKDMDDKTDLGKPVIVRKGRNVFGGICKEAPTRKFFDNIVNAFKEKTKASEHDRLSNLGYITKGLSIVQAY